MSRSVEEMKSGPTASDSGVSGSPPENEEQTATARPDQMGCASDNPVGYRSPPVHTRFKPGESGNPKGRPKGAAGLKTLVRSMMTEEVTVGTPVGAIKISRVEATLLKMYELAIKGNLRAQSQLLALYDAAVPQALEALNSDETDDRLNYLQELSRRFLEGAFAEE